MSKEGGLQIPQAPQDDKKDKPVAETKAEGQKLEWGPELGLGSWDEAQAKIEELNSELAEGEKPWRLPAIEELQAEFKKTNSTPSGFRRYYYWSGTTHPFVSIGAGHVDMENGNAYYNPKENPSGFVRLVRDAA